MAEWIVEIKDGKFPIGKWTKLVRCKDYKHRYGDKDEPYCSRIDPYMRMCVGDEDFYSWGEKNG